MSDAPTDAEVVAAWNRLAAFWDKRSGPDGGEIHRLLISPSVHRLLNVQPGEQVLEVGCGNGVTSREVAALGARVIATDASDAFLDLARRHSNGDEIDYRIVDATDEATRPNIYGRHFLQRDTRAQLPCWVMSSMSRAPALWAAAGRCFVRLRAGRREFRTVHEREPRSGSTCAVQGVERVVLIVPACIGGNG